jgi:hypothetical protein
MLGFGGRGTTLSRSLAAAISRAPGMTDLLNVYARMPRLQDSAHGVTSEPTDQYNCVAWVERDFAHWWQPEFDWPNDLQCPPPGEPDLPCYVSLFRRWGFEPCETDDFEPGFLKIAIYSKDGFFHHVAKQVPPIRWWSSKVGAAHDFKHERLDALYESLWFDAAEVTHFMKRAYDLNDDFALEVNGLLLP